MARSVSFCHDDEVRARYLFLISVVAAVLLAWAGDTALAARTERRLAEHLPAGTEVYVGGFPFVGNYVREDIPDMYIAFNDINYPPWGLLRISQNFLGVNTTVERLNQGELAGSMAKQVRTRINVDAVSIGAALGIPDVELMHPYDISPRGGDSAEVVLRGTPEQIGQRYAVLAHIRLDNGVFQLIPHHLIDAPPGVDTELLAPFRWSFDTRELPLPQQADAVAYSGGSLVFECTQRSVPVEVGPLYPNIEKAQY
ncbi:DUF2993 domain-containing protein [Corynebacterium sp. ES2715-CONJ3]|uniref:DUF2993 domain-containing protein n=1 Tax=Corynebacterium sp. ES2715-CONJ3 TaxID=2974028 RepID=UPI002168AC15|nr:DUF2993 domain-containing protein [Corynebacterium sp. ES2715-CONJ3]